MATVNRHNELCRINGLSTFPIIVEEDGPFLSVDIKNIITLKTKGHGLYRLFVVTFHGLFFRSANSNTRSNSIDTNFQSVNRKELLRWGQEEDDCFLAELYELWRDSKDYSLLSKFYKQIEQNPSNNTFLIKKYFRIQKFILQSAAKSLLRSHFSLHFNSCLSIPVSYRSSNTVVEIVSSVSKLFDTEQLVRYRNLNVCSNIWACPVCSSIITERRKNEILLAVQNYRDEKYGISPDDLLYSSLKGGEIVMGTFTVPHLLNGMRLVDFVERFNEAFDRLKAHRSYISWKISCGIEGIIHVLEVTFGEKYGWHVHAHVAFFMNKRVSYKELSGLPYSKNGVVDYTIRPKGELENKGENFYSDTEGQLFYEGKNSPMVNIPNNGLFPMWSKAVQRMGFAAPSPLAFDLSSGDALADYIAKYGREPQRLWDLSLELSKQHVKSKDKYGQREIRRASPFDLLRRYVFMGDSYAGHLFVEFAKAFKGKHNIHWSKGFKAKFGLKQLTDKEIAEGNIEDVNNVVLGSLNYKQWQRILREGSRALVLELCREEGFSSVLKYLYEIGDERQRSINYPSVRAVALSPKIPEGFDEEDVPF